MPKQSDDPREWYVNIPVSELHNLINQLDFMDSIKMENAQLRRELDGLRNMFTELQVAFGDLRRELKGR